MIRRAYKILSETDAHITRLAKDMKIDKEHVVQMALDAGLPEVEKRWEKIGKPSGLDLMRGQLMETRKGSIKKSSAKRRS